MRSPPNRTRSTIWRKLLECLDFTTRHPSTFGEVGVAWADAPCTIRVLTAAFACFTGQKPNTICRYFREHGMRRVSSSGRHGEADWKHPLLTRDVSVADIPQPSYQPKPDTAKDLDYFPGFAMYMPDADPPADCGQAADTVFGDYFTWEVR
jgi:hypothetical protein